MTDKMMCPICGEGYLEPARDEMIIEYRGVKHLSPMLYSVCVGEKGCGSETATAEQMRINKQDTVLFRRSVDEQLDGAS